jgi:hypothetical protein
MPPHCGPFVVIADLILSYTVKPIAHQSFYKECASVNYIKAFVYASFVDASNTNTSSF